MTYCLGWKTQTCAYLVADSAVTSGCAPSMLRSSFGEQHVTGERKNVEEGALKIISAPSAGLTSSARDATICFDIADTFRLALAVGHAPRQALESAIISNVKPGRVDFSLLCAFVEHGEPHLLSFNRDGEQGLVEHEAGDLVQLGALVGRGNVVSQISDAFIGYLTKSDLDGPASVACALGLCQSYGILNPLLSHGVGGAFVGAFVDASGFHWQPDMAYSLITPGEPPEYPVVFSFIRDDVLIVRSLLADGPRRIFMNSLGEPDETSNARAWRVDGKCLAALRELQFEYLVFLNTALPIVAVVEMAGRREHGYVILHPLQPPSPEGKALVHMSVAPPVSYLMMATGAQGPKPGARLGAMLHFYGYIEPGTGPPG
jgi:hypothetical protein